ncbi:MAG: MBL fold metallo-hydrolase [Cyclobacteriaceae bacterium]|jgi:metallo-beta-lactamase family protein|nr:MBL fold metallo-hydrolase [Cyclobacteriaceae bacterium]
MNVSLRFLGAAKSVTGSKYLLEIDHQRILVDGGLFQGRKELRLRNWQKLPVDPETIDQIIVTHAHIDHIGYLPRLVRDGFHGLIHCTHATKDLMKIMLKDAAKLQEEEALFALKQGYSKHSKPEPLFTEVDADHVMTLVRSCGMEKAVALSPTVSVRFFNSGHILGSAIVEVTLTGQTQEKKIVFSGDLGRYDDPIMYEPHALRQADVLVVESTYGDRNNPMGDVEGNLANIVNEAYDRQGAILIPAFAVGRTQTLIFYLIKLMNARQIPLLPIYIDSPMAINVTDLYERHSSHHKIKVTPEGNELMSLFDSRNIHFCNTKRESQALNSMRKPAIIISASGMATGGRILHHLYHRLGREEDTVLFAGYQGEGTRGRDILEGEPTVRIFGEEVAVRCQVRQINGLSAHGDQEDLLRWLHNFSENPKRVFITHGEEKAAEAFRTVMEEELGWHATVPDYLETAVLFEGV